MSTPLGVGSNTGCEWYHPTTVSCCASTCALSSTSATGSISTSCPDAMPRPGNARSTAMVRVTGSHRPPRYPMASLLPRWACRSMRSSAEGEHVMSNGCAPAPPPPGALGAKWRKGCRSRVPPPASRKHAPLDTTAVSRRGRFLAYSVGSTGGAPDSWAAAASRCSFFETFEALFSVAASAFSSLAARPLSSLTACFFSLLSSASASAAANLLTLSSPTAADSSAESKLLRLPPSAAISLSVSGLKPYCLAAAELGSSGLPESV
mmetsp:Transcript_6405/g.16322  ORF Transcript_6405/g.16322 Transcript_6405/m.16322 type:complete len:264 (+) Transcript_6405:597-1388(+)